MQRATLSLGWMIIWLVTLGLSGLALADEPNQAGLVVQFGDGHIESRCVTFEGGGISGADLLARSGLEAIVDPSSGMGVTVCQLEGEGCAFPAEPCFCQCMGGGECTYWNYFYRDPGASEWSYSPLGAGLRKVTPGSVEGWVWGDGQMPPAEGMTFEAICLPATAIPTEGPEQPTPLPATTTLRAVQVPSPTRTPDALPTATALPPSPLPPQAPGTEAELTSYWPFGLMVLGLALVGALVWLRRR